ncbi:receptor-like protein EIX1 [Lactuca sativa]|uniref:receptor-like protein EIX1 n=1 Tax=Lactuca sativa TaxID=4236 RepID=UPI000CB6819F|nr:receptor-like protein EIX1 [Lactuca sativa]
MGNQMGLGIHIIFVCVFLFAATYTCLGVGNVSVICSKQERLALLNFKLSVKYDSGILSSWVGNECCLWEGIQCDAVTGNVQRLHLKANYYYYISANMVNSSLAELRHLKYINLSGNRFHGSRIPEFIGSLKQLRYLNLSDAGFEGIIPPHIGNLSNLKVLDLSSNHYKLKADDMAWAFGLSSLELLNLSEVDLSGAQNWDMMLHMIPSLRELSLSHCRLSNVNLGPFLNSSRILPNIKHLDLGYNSFKGPLPVLQNMTSLTFLSLSGFNHSLTWNFPNLLSIIPSLSELHLSGCGLHGTHLSSPHLNFSTLSNIQRLDLSDNPLGGIFPSFLTNMSSLEVLDLSYTMLNSSLPIMPKLLELHLSGNKLKQIEDVGIWRECHLKQLVVVDNEFGMEMLDSPKNASECSQYSLELLELRGSLKGRIPETLGRLTNLRHLDLSKNKLTGTIPEFVRGLRFLQVLYLHLNQFIGPIPKFLGNLNLTQLDLSYNQLNGSIPESIGKLASLTDLYLRSNLLNGTIPVSIGQLTKLVVLDISNNSLDKAVTEAHFANTLMLKDLDASSNTKLTFNASHGWIPPFHLRYLDFLLRYNHAFIVV